MKARMFEIECPSCHETFFLMRDTYYVKGMDPIAEERLLNGSYFMHRCRKCDTIFTIYHPLLFRSPKKFAKLLYGCFVSLFMKRISMSWTVWKNIFQIMESDWWNLKVLIKNKDYFGFMLTIV